jgi:hypothetical protein
MGEKTHRGLRAGGRPALTGYPAGPQTGGALLPIETMQPVIAAFAAQLRRGAAVWQAWPEARAAALRLRPDEARRDAEGAAAALLAELLVAHVGWTEAAPAPGLRTVAGVAQKTVWVVPYGWGRITLYPEGAGAGDAEAAPDEVDLPGPAIFGGNALLPDQRATASAEVDARGLLEGDTAALQAAVRAGAPDLALPSVSATALGDALARGLLGPGLGGPLFCAAAHALAAGRLLEVADHLRDANLQVVQELRWSDGGPRLPELPRRAPLSAALRDRALAGALATVQVGAPVELPAQTFYVHPDGAGVEVAFDGHPVGRIPPGGLGCLSAAVGVPPDTRGLSLRVESGAAQIYRFSAPAWPRELQLELALRALDELSAALLANRQLRAEALARQPPLRRAWARLRRLLPG